MHETSRATYTQHLIFRVFTASKTFLLQVPPSRDGFDSEIKEEGLVNSLWPLAI